MSQKPSQGGRPRKPIIREQTDGISRIVETIRALPGTPTIKAAELRELRRAIVLAADSFESQIRSDLQRWSHITVPRNADPDLTSPEWYAISIRDLATHVRAELRANPEAELAVVHALRLGKMLADGAWRFQKGDHIRRDLKATRDRLDAAHRDRPRTKHKDDNDRLKQEMTDWIEQRGTTKGMIPALARRRRIRVGDDLRRFRARANYHLEKLGLNLSE